MRTIKNSITTIILLISYNVICLSQNLDLLPQAQRDSILISISKEVVLKYGPGYYREYKEPLIERKLIGKNGHRDGVDANRPYYKITSYYDPKKEALEWGYASRVYVWADTGKPHFVSFGNGNGLRIPEIELREGEEIRQVPYQPGTSLRQIFTEMDTTVIKK